MRKKKYTRGKYDVSQSVINKVQLIQNMDLVVTKYTVEQQI